MAAQDYKTPLMELERKDLLSNWNRTSVAFETLEGLKGKIMRAEESTLEIVPELPSGPQSLRIQVPGNVYEIQGEATGSTFIVDKFFKINRREAFRLTMEGQKASVSFNHGRTGIIAQVEDISLEGVGFSGGTPLASLKQGEKLTKVKITLETKEIEVDLEVRRVLQKDKVLVGGRFIKIHTGGGAGILVNYINVSLYNRKKLE